MEAGCKHGVLMKADRVPCGGAARSGRFSRIPQTKIRHLKPPRACKKPLLSTCPEQAWISVHHLSSLLPARGQYVFTGLIKSARSARDERQRSLFHAWSAEGGRKHKPAQRDQTKRKIQMSSSELSCPAAMLPIAASPARAAHRDPGPSSLPLLLQSSFKRRGCKGSFYGTISLRCSVSP